MTLQEHCQYCNKVLRVESEVPLGNKRFRKFTCGHISLIESQEVALADLDFGSVDGKMWARDYQKAGIKFGIDSGFACIIGDQMRLGKTPQALLMLKNAIETRTPCLTLVRSANAWQWHRETKTWVSRLPLTAFVIKGTKGIIPPGFTNYICSMDTFSRPGMVEQLLEFGFKLVIVDEAHSFKNSDSARSRALVQFLHEIAKTEYSKTVDFQCWHCDKKWQETVTLQAKLDNGFLNIDSYKYSECKKCGSRIGTRINSDRIKCARKCGIIMLTGTPIKNRAEEYFIPLNLVDPANFPSLESFRRQWLEQDSKGKWSRIKSYRLEEFREKIAPYYLRREKEDVYTDLPLINRIFTVIEVDDVNLKKAYNHVLDVLEEKQGAIGNLTFANSIGEFAQLRRICGLAKIQYAAEYAQEIIDESENQRIAIGIHHEDVRELLALRMGKENCLVLSGKNTAEQKDWIMRRFQTSKERSLILNMIAGGVGMDFHYCNNVLILERMWSSADEEQFEFRFYNPDRSIMGNNNTTCEYIIAKGTIDAVLYDLIEEKRQIFGETVGNHWDVENDPATFKELVQRTLSSRLN